MPHRSGPRVEFVGVANPRCRRGVGRAAPDRCGGAGSRSGVGGHGGVPRRRPTIPAFRLAGASTREAMNDDAPRPSARPRLRRLFEAGDGSPARSRAMWIAIPRTPGSPDPASRPIIEPDADPAGQPHVVDRTPRRRRDAPAGTASAPGPPRPRSRVRTRSTCARAASGRPRPRRDPGRRRCRGHFDRPGPVGTRPARRGRRILGR
jgi:hypothetical protein